MVISFSSVTKYFGKKAAVDNISLTIPENSVFLLVGPNGAGKTTFLRLLTGELKLNKGNIRIEKHKHFALADENRDYFKNFDAENYVKIFELLYPEFDTKKFHQIFSELKIPLNKPVEQYSKGMKTWLHNSLTVSSNSKIMIFDEPLQHLDPSVRMIFHSILQNESACGKTQIISTHEISEFENYAQNIAIINNGKIILTGEVDKIIFNHRIIPGTESVLKENLIGPIFNEKLVKTHENTGRKPLLKEIVTGYINGNSIDN